MAPASTPLPVFDRSLLHPGDRVCVAVSGGADSVALLRLLLLTNAADRDALGVGLSAVHVHHGLRGEEANADLDFVQELCRGLGVTLAIHHVDVAGRVSRKGETVEEAARELRYGVFREMLGRGEANCILTAHTLDDQAETVLMKLLRGAWTSGLAGIHPTVQLRDRSSAVVGSVGRPLLATRRAELETFLRSLGQPWRNDSTNDDLAFTRNRLRREVIPLLRTFNPSLDEALGHLAELARDEEARWTAELERLLPQLLLPGKPVRGGGRAVATGPEQGSLSVSLEIERLRPFDPALRRRVLRAAAARLGCSLNFDGTARLLALCGFAQHPNVSSRPGARLELSGQLRASRSARELQLSRDLAANLSNPVG